MDSLSLLLSKSHHPKAVGHHRRTPGPGEIYRHAAAARQCPYAETDEARLAWRLLPEAAGKDPSNHSRSRHSHQHDRRVPGETEADFEILSDFVKAANFDRL